VAAGAEPTLAGAFPPATEDDWRAGVDKVLRGAPFDKLVSRTADDIAVLPLYVDGPDESATGTPGSAPFTRGFHAAPRPEGAWDVRAVLAHPDPGEANRLALRELERGSTSLLVRFDAATRAGIAPGGHGYDDLGAHDGVAGTGADTLGAVLDGVLLDLAPVVLQAGASFAAAADWLVQLWEGQGMAGTDASGGFGADPIGTLATTGSLPQGIDAALADMADLAARTAARHPGVRAVTIDATPYAEAGGSEAQELGAMLATGAAYLRALADTGVSAEDAAAQIEIVLGADADFFTTMAKVRAARRAWAAMASACGIDSSVAAPTVTVRTLDRMMSRRDPWVNLLRVTSASFGAVLGGADAVATRPFDAELGEPGELGRRMARNTQLLLGEESGAGRVVDPAGGSWYVETLTEELATAAWDLFRVLEGAGGMPAVLLDGTLATRIAGVRDARFTAVARRKSPLTGVSEFPNIDEEPVATEAVDRVALRAASSSDGELVEAGSGSATICEPLGAVRWAEQFEALRDAADASAATTGSRPLVFLANLGPVATHTARASFAKNFFEVGGIAAVTSEAGSTVGLDADSVAADFAASGARLACICSSDDLYAEQAAAVAAALKAAGAQRVYLAGNPGDRRDQLTAAGVDEFAHVGVDVLAALRTAHEALGTDLVEVVR